MGWVIRIGRTGFERGANAGVITSFQCFVTSSSCHAVAQVMVTPNAGRTTSEKAGSMPACHAEQVWQNVLSTLVGMD
ncbi:hypothetical protein [Noviherbaspirillum cavernae]|uniref:hypothetical protein n=1 Tax=Noviherbaspirillum cavernae TaxID=2320862 RepID=UPI0011C3496B|nr:hypothetical protein [Noviherbaspirillum cavernae]